MKPITTSERGRELAAVRWNTAERIARKALQEKLGVSSWGAGWAEVVGNQADIAAHGKKGSTPAAAFVGRAAGLMRDRTSTPSDAPSVVVNNYTATVSLSLLRQAAALLGDGDAGAGQQGDERDAHT